MAAKYGSLQQNQWASYQLEDTLYNFGAGQTNAVVLSVGGIYRATLPTYTDNDAAMAHFTAAGRLMVDTELSLDGDVIVNNLGGAAAKDAPIAGNPIQMGTEAATFDGAALPTAVNAEGDVTYPKSSLQGVLFVSPLNADGSLATIYGEDTVHTTGHGGTFVLAVRNDAGTSLVGTDGDYAPLQVDSAGALHVALTGADYADDSNQFTVGTSPGFAFMAVNTADAVDAGDIGALAMTTSRRLHVATSSLNNPAVTNASAALAINTTTAVANHFRLVAVTCRFNIAPTTSQNFVVTLDALDGAAYDTVLFSVDPSASAATDIVYIPDKELLFESGDEIVVTFTNTDARTYGLRIVTQLL